MRRSGKPKFAVTVTSDWSSVIAVREYWDVLIEQKPCVTSEDDEYSEHTFNVPCGTIEDLLKALNIFRERRLPCSIAAQFRSEDGVSAYLELSRPYTADGYASIDVPDAALNSAERLAITEAINVLTKAIA